VAIQGVQRIKTPVCFAASHRSVHAPPLAMTPCSEHPVEKPSISAKYSAQRPLRKGFHAQSRPRENVDLAQRCRDWQTSAIGAALLIVDGVKTA